MNRFHRIAICGSIAVMLIGSLSMAGAPTTPPEAPAKAPIPDPTNMKAFPAAADGQTRFVLPLPAATDEDALKVEIYVGKIVQTDAVNRYFFGGKIEAVNIEGWGFTKYVVKELGPMAGTLMAPPPNAPKVDRFVTLSGEPYLVRYNSKLPIVVYVPKGVEVRYRIWSAGKTTPATPG